MNNVLWGPVYFILDAAPANRLFGVVSAAMLLAAVFALVRKPRLATAFLSVLAGLLWLVIGVLGRAIGC